MRQTRPYMVIGLCRSLVYTCASTASNLCSHCPHPVLCTASYPVPTLPPTCANLLRFLYSPFYFHISSLSSYPPPGILSSILGRVFCYARHHAVDKAKRSLGVADEDLDLWKVEQEEYFLTLGDEPESRVCNIAYVELLQKLRQLE